MVELTAARCRPDFQTARRHRERQGRADEGLKRGWRPIPRSGRRTRPPTVGSA